ncbi:tRNA-intron lyase [Candidatus Woesearchaeota archaeon]|nr:tRNA-intron lyase [Candidatus Woesearchaeota archaeon]MBW3013710.1 tRNA-intron lyase [Candidatus Woesearchaeota archaeon]
MAKKAAKKKTTKKAKEIKKEKEAKSEPKTKSKRKPELKAKLISERVLVEASDQARELYNQGRYGIILDNGELQLNLIEALFLLEKGKIKIMSGRKKMTAQTLIKSHEEQDPNFWVRYVVYRDFRNRGYIISTALKFGADFRVYDRGMKPGNGHAKWLVFPVSEDKVLSWYEFAAKNRVATSTKKRLLIGIVDKENDVTYYEIRWMRP